MLTRFRLHVYWPTCKVKKKSKKKRFTFVSNKFTPSRIRCTPMSTINLSGLLRMLSLFPLTHSGWLLRSYVYKRRNICLFVYFFQRSFSIRELASPLSNTCDQHPYDKYSCSPFTLFPIAIFQNTHFINIIKATSVGDPLGKKYIHFQL